MKVVLFAPAFSGAGGERVAAAWFEGLTAAGHVVVPMQYESRPVPTVLRTTVQVEGHSHLGRVRNLSAHLSEAKPDVLIAVLTYANLLALTAAPKRLPVVISEHTVPSLLLRSEGRSGQLKMAAAKLVYRRASCAIGVSHAVATDLVGSFRTSPDRTFVLRNPIASGISTRERDPVSSVAGPTPIFVGRFTEHKDPISFLRLISFMRPQAAVMIGDGPLRGECEGYAQTNSLNVSFLGWVEEWWRSALPPNPVLVITSAVEGFGNVLVEASMAGIPTVASSQALGVADAIIDGSSGALALSRRPQHLADAVRAAHASRSSGDNQWSTKVLASRHDLKRITSQLLEVVGVAVKYV